MRPWRIQRVAWCFRVHEVPHWILLSHRQRDGAHIVSRHHLWSGRGRDRVRPLPRWNAVPDPWPLCPDAVYGRPYIHRSLLVRLRQVPRWQ